MQQKVQDKMYTLPGGMSPDTMLCETQFYTKQGFARIPSGHISKLFDIALEVDLTGLGVEFSKYGHDAYWSCDSKICLDDNRVKLATVAYVDHKWITLDIDPFTDAYHYLKNQGYDDKLGYGSGWFSKGKYPTYKELAFGYFLPSGYSGINRIPEFDVKTGEYMGVWGDARHDQIKIYNGQSKMGIKKFVGTIRVEGETVVIKLHDDEYRFHSDKDEDFIRWSRMCVESYNAEFLKYPRDEDSRRPDSNNREHLTMSMRFEEALRGKPTDLKKFLDSRIEQEVGHAQRTFRHEMRPYLER